VLVPENTVESVKDSLINGRTFCYRRWSVSGTFTTANPVVEDIIVNQRDKTIRVVCDDSYEIEWVSCGQVISTDFVLDLHQVHAEKYVRFVLTAKHSTFATNPERRAELYSQPFYLAQGTHQ